MSISSTSYVASVASQLQRLNDLRLQQIDVDLQVADSMRQARQKVVDQSLQDVAKQSECVNEVKRAALQARSGGIDVWA